MQAYLNEHLLRSFSMKSTASVRQTTLRPRHLRRRMSCKGAIKKTRSINADSDTLGMEGHVIERRQSTVAPNWSEERNEPRSQSFSKIIVTPPHEHGRLERMHEFDSENDKPKIKIKDRHDGKYFR